MIRGVINYIDHNNGDAVCTSCFSNEHLENEKLVSFPRGEFPKDAKAGDWFILHQDPIRIEMQPAKEWLPEEAEAEYKRLMETLPDEF